MTPEPTSREAHTDNQREDEVSEAQMVSERHEAWMESQRTAIEANREAAAASREHAEAMRTQRAAMEAFTVWVKACHAAGQVPGLEVPATASEPLHAP